MKDRRTAKGRRAFVTVYMAFAMMALIPMVGLAIDFTVLYNVKARLQQACDAAAIGAGSQVQRTTDVTDPTQNAALKDAVLRYFNANFLPAPWGATQASYASSITQDATTKIRTIYVTAKYYVPMLFMRVLRINASQVAAQAIADLRFVNLVIVVDRSGSVSRTGSGTQTNQQIIETDLTQFAGVNTPSTSIFVNGRDVVGLLSFGGTYNVDLAPTTNFQTVSPNINTQISKLNFDTNSSTNTGEGLYQAWYQLAQLNQTGALNVILLITDGRPSAFSSPNFAVKNTSSCTSKTAKSGFIDSPVSTPFPPPSSRGIFGVLQVWPMCTTSGCEASTLAANSSGCAYASSTGNVGSDIPAIPDPVGPATNTTGTHVPNTTTFSSTTGYFTGGGTNISGSGSNPALSVRYAAFNYAYNVAQAIQKDTTYAPVIYCVGLNFDTTKYTTEEPLDADFLATVANDPSYVSQGIDAKFPKGSSVYTKGLTPGRYYDVTYSGLAAALEDITSQILRLAAH